MSAVAGPNAIEDSLICCLDAGNTNSYPGTGSTWFDLSKNGNDGTIQNAVFNSTNKCFEFIVSDTNRRIDFTTINLNTPNTYEFWLRTPFSEGQGIASPFLNSGEVNLDFYITWPNGNSNPYYYFFVSYDDGTRLRNQTPFLDAGGLSQWHQLVIVISTTGCKVFYNGENLVLTDAGSGKTGVNATDTLLSLGGGTNTIYDWDGDIAIFKLYDKELTAAEIKQNYNALRGRFAS